MYFMISYSCLFVNNIHYLSEIPSDITFSQFLFYFYHYHLLVHLEVYHFLVGLLIHPVHLYQIYVTTCKPTILILFNSCSATDAASCLSILTRFTSSILSFTLLSFSFLYALFRTALIETSN